MLYHLALSSKYQDVTGMISATILPARHSDVVLSLNLIQDDCTRDDPSAISKSFHAQTTIKKFVYEFQN